MSIPISDFRCKITPEVDALLETMHRTSGRDKTARIRGRTNESRSQ